MRTLALITTVLLLAAGARGQQEDDIPTWTSLSAEHDTDGNGAISREEYDGDDERFAGLDADGDEVLTVRDFEGPGRGPAASGGERAGDERRDDDVRGRGDDDGDVRGRRGEPDDRGRDARRDARPTIDSRTLAALVFHSTKTHPRAQQLEERTLREGFARLDRDSDGRWSRAEFEAGAGHDPGQSIRGLQRGDDRFAALLEGLDADVDDHVSRAEAEALFGVLDLDDDGVWTTADRGAWHGDEPVQRGAGEDGRRDRARPGEARDDRGRDERDSDDRGRDERDHDGRHPRDPGDRDDDRHPRDHDDGQHPRDHDDRDHDDAGQDDAGQDDHGRRSRRDDDDGDDDGHAQRPSRGDDDLAADRARTPSGITPGARAVDFTLTPAHGGEPVTLSSFAGDRPVALIFGSYT